MEANVTPEKGVGPEEQYSSGAAGQIQGSLVELSTFGLLRLALLPCTALLELRPVTTIRLLDEMAQAHDRLRELNTSLCDALFSLVPSLDHDPSLRRKALSLRRSIHNLERTKLGQEDIAAIISRTTSEMQQGFSTFFRLQDEFIALSAGAELTLSGEIAAVVRPRLRQATKESRFQQGLALASQDTLRAALRPVPGKESIPSPKLERTLLSYLSRCVAKTSPFSTFMVNCHFSTEATRWGVPLSISDAEVGTRIRANRGIQARAINGILSGARLPSSLPLRWNETARRLAPDKVYVLISQLIVMIGRPWRQQRPAVFRFHPGVLDLLFGQNLTASAQEYLSLLQTIGLELPRAEALLRKLIESNILQLPVFTDAYDDLPFSSATAMLAEHPSSAAAGELVSDLTTMQQLATQVGKRNRRAPVRVAGHRG